MEETYCYFQFLRCDWLYRRDRLCLRLEVFRQFVVTSFFMWFEYVFEVFRKCVGFLFVAMRPSVLRRIIYTQGGICLYVLPCESTHSLSTVTNSVLLSSLLLPCPVIPSTGWPQFHLADTLTPVLTFHITERQSMYVRGLEL